MLKAWTDALENWFISNIISNFKGNLISEELEAHGIGNEEEESIKTKFAELFKKTESALREMEGISVEDYNVFKGQLQQMSSGGYKLLLDIEKLADFNACQREISRFREHIETLGGTFVVKVSEEGRCGLSVRFEEEHISEDTIQTRNPGTP